MFYSSSFDPGRIILQMVAMQCGYYMLLGFSFLCINVAHDKPLSISHLLSSIHLDDTAYVGAAIAHLATAIGFAFLLRFIVQRAKKCLDFGCTAYAFAIFWTVIYDGRLPLTWTYWLVQLFCVIVAVSLGEYICMRKEMEEIPIGFFNVPNQTSATPIAGTSSTLRSPGGGPASPAPPADRMPSSGLFPN